MTESPPPVEASRRRILVEIVLYVLLVVLFGAAFVAYRVHVNGPSVLSFDPHGRADEPHETR